MGSVSCGRQVKRCFPRYITVWKKRLRRNTVAIFFCLKGSLSYVKRSKLISVASSGRIQIRRQKLQRGKFNAISEVCISVVFRAEIYWLPCVVLSTPSPEVSEHRLLVLRLKRDKISSKALSSSKPGHPHCPHHLSDTSGQANSGFHYLLLCQMWSLIFLGSLWHSRGLRSVALLGQLWRGGGGGLNHENQVRDKM